MRGEIEITHEGTIYTCDYIEKGDYCALRDETCDIESCLHWRKLRYLEEIGNGRL